MLVDETFSIIAKFYIWFNFEFDLHFICLCVCVFACDAGHDAIVIIIVQHNRKKNQHREYD